MFRCGRHSRPLANGDSFSKAHLRSREDRPLDAGWGALPPDDTAWGLARIRDADRG